MANSRKILNIIPAATGINSMYSDEDNKIEVFPLVCWALIEKQDGTTAVVGMDMSQEKCTELVFCDDDPAFIGYASEQEIEKAGQTSSIEQ